MTTPRPPNSAKVLLGLSGNLMSSVVAALLKHQGFQIVALHFQVEDGARAEAQRVAQKLGLHLVIEEALAAVEQHVRDPIVHQVLANRRPEPAVMAHQKILIDGLCSKARELGCGMIATGHSARVVLDPSTGLTRLVRAADVEHDQSHLLFGLRAPELQQFILPAGDLSAAAVERLAIELELDLEKLRGPSHGFCAIPEEQFLAIAEPRIPSTMKVPGQIKTAEGTVVGDHEGLYRYRRGQPIVLKGKGEGLVVTDTIHRTHTLVIGLENLLMTQVLNVDRVNWIQKVDPIHGFACEARLAPGALARARVTPFQHGYVRVELEQPHKNILPGQAVVFYRGDEVLGGGFAV